MNTYLKIASSPLLWVFLIMVAAAFGIMKVLSIEVKLKRYEIGWVRKNYVRLLITAASLLAMSAIYFYLYGIGVSLSSLVARLRYAVSKPETKPEDLRHLGTAVALLMTVMAAAATIIFSIIRVWINERNASAAEEGLITERISKAVEGLGAEKTVRDPQQNEEFSAPNLEVRIGAIFALERIAQDSIRDSVQITEILCAYIRNCSPCVTGELDSDTEIRPRIDVQTCLNVIARRTSKQKRFAKFELGKKKRFDLSRSNLRGAEIWEGDFSGFEFQFSNFDGCDIRNVDFTGVAFQGNTLSFSNFFESDFSNSRFIDSTLPESSTFAGCKFKKCGFYDIEFSNFPIKSTQIPTCIFATSSENSVFSHQKISHLIQVESHPDFLIRHQRL